MADSVLPSYSGPFIGAYPDELIDPKDKGYSWHMAACQALYQKQTSVLYLNNQRRVDYAENRAYADGLQSTQKYTDRLSFDHEDEHGNKERVSYRNLNWGIHSTAPKIVDAILGYWEKLDYDIFFDCLNPMAQQDRKFIMGQMQAKASLKEFNNYVNQMLGVDPQADVDMPESLEEIQTFLDEGFRLPYEMCMELGVQLIQEESDWKTIKRQLRRELICNGACCAKVWVDRISQRVKMRYCDLVNVVIEDFHGVNGAASKGIGEVIPMTVGDLMLEWGDQFTIEEYYDMAKNAVSLYGNPGNIVAFQPYYNTDAQYLLWQGQWDNYKILVFDWEMWSTDVIKKKYVIKDGITKVYNVDNFNKAKAGFKEKKSPDGTIYTEEIKSTAIKTVRGGKWVVNSSYMADWGKKYDIARPNENKRECYREYQFYRAANKSIIERILPILDQMQLAVLGKNNLMERVMPPGYDVEMSAFDNVLVDSKIRSSEELITMAMQTGTQLWRKKVTYDDSGYPDQSPPIQWQERNFGQQLMAYWDEIYKNIALIREITGINEMLDAGPQKSDQGLGTSQLALQGAENTLSPIIQGMISMHEMIAYTTMLKLQVVARNGKISGYVTQLGTGFKTLVELGDEISALSYGIRCQALPTMDQRAEIMKVAGEAVTSNLETGRGGIEISDYIKLEQYLATRGNLKLAAMMLDKSIKKAQDKAQKMAQENEKANTEKQIMSAKSAEEEKRKTAQMDFQGQSQLEILKSKLKIQEMQAQAQLNGRSAILDNALEKHANEHAASLQTAENA